MEINLGGNMKSTNLSEESFFASKAAPETWETEAIEGQLAVDVYQTKTEMVVKAPIAGVDPEDLDITVTSDMVTIKGERYDEKEVDTDSYHSQECYWGAFARTVMLPVEGDSQKAEAVFKKGVLQIRIPKASANKTKKVEIKAL